MIPVLFAMDLNSRQYNRISYIFRFAVTHTPDNAIQDCLYSEPYLSNPTRFLNSEMDVLMNCVVKRGAVSDDFRRTEHGRP